MTRGIVRVHRAIVFAACLACLLGVARTFAAEAAVEAAIGKGRDFLLAQLGPGMSRGELALGVLALAKAGLSPDDPKMAPMVAELVKTASVSTYQPEGFSGVNNYEAAVHLMALSAIDPVKYQRQIENIAKYLMKKQLPSGPWDYDNSSGGDTSQTQYGILGLWEASNAGVDVSDDVWDRTLVWLMATQDLEGGFTYHPSVPPGRNRIKQSGVSHSMSVAGTGTMIICRSKLKFAGGGGRVFEQELTEEEKEFAYLRLADDQPGVDAPPKPKKPQYQMQATRAEADQAIQMGLRWVNSNFTIDKPVGPQYYYLYALERLGNLAGRKDFGERNWYDSGAVFLVNKQGPRGNWEGTYQPPVDTSFGMLFLLQSTKKSLQRIQLSRLKEGTVIGGRGIPTGETSDRDMFFRQERRYRDAMRLPIEEVLESLEAPEESNLFGAAAAIETADPDEIAEKFGKNRRALRRLAKNSRPEAREAALWAAARLRDYTLVPVLIEGLSDPSPEVYLAARDGLRFVSRRIEGFGLPDEPPGKEELQKGINAWRDWFRMLRIEIPAEQEFDDGL